MMPDAVTPTWRRTSPDTDDSPVFPLAERLTPSPLVLSELKRDDDMVDDRPREVGVHGADEPVGGVTSLARCAQTEEGKPGKRPIEASLGLQGPGRLHAGGEPRGSQRDEDGDEKDG